MFVQEETVMFGEYTVENEYDPLAPNDYVKCSALKEIEIQKRKAEEKAKSAVEKQRFAFNNCCRYKYIADLLSNEN